MPTDRPPRVVPIRLSDESELLVEVTNLDSEMLVSYKVGDIHRVLDLIGSMSGELLRVIRQVGPDRAKAEFGLEVALKSGELTALWVQASGKANLNITLEWERRDNT